MDLDLKEYERYGRQMIMPEVGLPGQLKIKNSKVLVVGAGGLGSPAIEYLAGCGVGTLGIVDHDYVEISNVHRQVIHSQPGLSKCESAKQFVNKLNPNVKVLTFETEIDATNAVSIIEQFDLVLGCVDGITARYVINDACVLLNRPLVSGAALGIDGQLAIYNYKNGPCYRCLFPSPPPPELAPACSDVGVLGPVVGVIGVMQAGEAIKIILEHEPQPPFLLIFCLTSFPLFRQVKIRPKQSSCKVCGDIKITSMNPADYQEQITCNVPSSVNSITCYDLKNCYSDFKLVDVRSPTQFNICSLPNSVNIPFSTINNAKTYDDLPDTFKSILEADIPQNLAILCRRGVDSQTVCKILHKFGISSVNVAGGILKWSELIDPEFPVY